MLSVSVTGASRLAEVAALIAVCIVGGIIGGMGMGGGTLLIPLLTLVCGMGQHAAQAINLVAFIPMSVVALVIHTKNGLVEYKKVLAIALPALAASVACSLVSLSVGERALKISFGVFLCALGAYQLITTVMTAVAQRKEEEIRRLFCHKAEPKKVKPPENEIKARRLLTKKR